MIQPRFTSALPTFCTVEHTLAVLESSQQTAVDMVKTAIQRIEDLDRQGPALRAMVTVNPHAIALAAASDERRARRALRSRLDGIPVTVKDCIETSDMPTTHGSMHFQKWLPEHDATIVKRLHDAGVIILGKTNMDDFAAATQGRSSNVGLMANPYDLTRGVGGSSGGSAISVAVGYAPLSIGTDTGGSLRIPAALTGVATMRPSTGMVSRTGIFPRSPWQDTAGPIAQTVLSLAHGMDLIAGFDQADTTTERSKLAIPPGGFARHIENSRSQTAYPLRLGYVRSGLALWGDDPSGPVVQRIDKAVDELEANQAIIVRLHAPPSELLAASSAISWQSQAAVDEYFNHRPHSPVARFEELCVLPDVPASVRESFDRELAYPSDWAGRTAQATAVWAARETLAAQTFQLLESENLDAIVYPAVQQSAELREREQAGLFTRWAEHTGFPSVVVPLLTSSGLPCGLEILG